MAKLVVLCLLTAPDIVQRLPLQAVAVPSSH
jgi:hypothetical protein